MKIHHIGYLVKNIEKAALEFEKAGYKAEGECIYDPIRDIDILFMINSGYRIELVSPKSCQSVVSETIKKMGNTPYHICYCCGCIEQEQQRLRKEGYLPVGKIEPAVAIEGNKVCFMLSRQIGLIELVENK